MIVRTGVSSILVFALETVSVSMSRMMSLTEGERSFRATSPDGMDAPDGLSVPRWWCRPLEEASVGQANTIGLDIAKRFFQAHGADASGRVVFRKRLVRAKVLEFFAAQPPCTVAMEACAGAHHWARELGKLGHTVRLIPPAYVKPYVKRQKNDMADAEAICEAAQRPSMRFVPVKTEEQQ